MKVLVTGAGALLGQGIIRSLRGASLDVEVVAVDPSPYAVGLYWADSRYLVPAAARPEFMAEIETILDRERPDAVMVGTDVELLAFAEHRHRLEETYETSVVVSDPDVVRIADDKYCTFEFLVEHGFAAPRSCLPSNRHDLEQLIATAGFPLVVKPRVGARSLGLNVVSNERELAAALKGTADAVVQEQVGSSDQEYTAGVVCFDGRCAASIVMRRDLRDGNTYRAFVTSDERLNAFVVEVAERLQPYGPANFQFRAEAGEFKIFEINARFSGTTPLRMSAGFNEVEMVLRHVCLGEPVRQPALRHVTMLRYWSEEVVEPADVLGAS